MFCDSVKQTLKNIIFKIKLHKATFRNMCLNDCTIKVCVNFRNSFIIENIRYLGTFTNVEYKNFPTRKINFKILCSDIMKDGMKSLPETTISIII